MSVNPTTQLVLLIYEYLYNKGNQLEKAYIDELNSHYKDMFNHRPDLVVDSFDLLKLIETRAKFLMFMDIQKDMYELLKLYKPGTMNNPDR